MGCCNSKDERPRPAGGPPANADTVIMRPEKPAEAPAAPAQPVHAAPAAPVAVSKQRTLTVYLVYYSTYGHTEALVRAMAEAMSTPEGDVRAQCFQVPETLSEGALEKMAAPHKPLDHPAATPSLLTQADALVFAFPTRFGAMCAQMKHFWDATGDLWQNGALAGKPVTCVVSTGTQGGGQETTMLTTATQLVHHGMIFIPLGYTAPDIMMRDSDEPRGGGPWGAGTFAGAAGDRKPSATELELARRQAEWFVEKARKLAA